MSELKRAAVIGAGTMGPGMGAVLERANLRVALFDVDTDVLERARSTVGLAQSVLDNLGVEASTEGEISFESELASALEGADVVLEAVPEQLELKQEVFTEFEKHVGDEVVLASNTSGIPVTKIAEPCAHPERVIGMHWSNPPHLIPMIEVIPGEATTQEVTERTSELVKSIGYYPVTVNKEVPGFVENRVLYAIMRECLALVEEGVIDAEGMDLNVKWGIGYKLAVIPPMSLLDVAGLDIYESVAGYLNPDLSTESGVSDKITELTSEGKLGLKTGGGIYEYTEEQLKELPAKRAQQLVAVRKALS